MCACVCVCRVVAQHVSRASDIRLPNIVLQHHLTSYAIMICCVMVPCTMIVYVTACCFMSHRLSLDGIRSHHATPHRITTRRSQYNFCVPYRILWVFRLCASSSPWGAAARRRGTGPVPRGEAAVIMLHNWDGRVRALCASNNSITWGASARVRMPRMHCTRHIVAPHALSDRVRLPCRSRSASLKCTGSLHEHLLTMKIENVYIPSPNHQGGSANTTNLTN